MQSNLVITNSLGPADIVRYNWVDLGSKMSEKFVRYNQVFVITEFVITELHFLCKFLIKLIQRNHDGFYVRIVESHLSLIRFEESIEEKIMTNWRGNENHSILKCFNRWPSFIFYVST